MTRARPTAYNYALNLLAARPYASSALRRKLIQKEYSAADADDAIRRLLDNGLLNDAKFAEQYARSKMLSTGASKRRLTQDLYRKGIKGDVATAAIANVVEQDEIDPAALIERVATKSSRNSAISSPLFSAAASSLSSRAAGTISMRSRPSSRA